MKKLLLSFLIIIAAFNTQAQTIQNTIDTVRLINDTAISTQTRPRGITHQIAGFLNDTTLGIMARLATTVSGLSTPTFQSVLNINNNVTDSGGWQNSFTSNWRAENAFVTYGAEYGMQGSIGSTQQFYFGWYGTVTPSLGITDKATPSFGIADSAGNMCVFVVPSGKYLASSEQDYGIPWFRGGTLALVGNNITPTQVPGTGAGTSPTIAFSTNADDNSGLIAVVPGTSPAGSSAIITTITFNTAYPGKAIVTLTPANAAAAALNGATQVWAVCNNPATTITIYSGSSALTASTTYTWAYSVSQ